MDDLKQKKILIVDDEADLRQMVDGILRREGFTRIHHAADCQEALAVIRAEKPDVAILDVMLPDGDGFSLLSAVRRFSQMPVLFLSARGEDEDRLLGLGLGADDYVVKPFLPRELVLRLLGILRRVYAPQQDVRLPVFELGEVTVDLEGALVRGPKGDQPLTAKEHALLRKLYENRGKIVTSDALCQAVWGDNYFGYENSLMVHIRRIREKIEENPSKPRYLLTVRGLGYKLITKER